VQNKRSDTRPMLPTLAQLNISQGGMPKRAVARASVTRGGVEGDRQRSKKYHGGSDRAVCLFSVEHYDWLRENEIDLEHGSVGENFTTAGVDLDALAKGDRLRVGACLIEITDVRIPCSQLNQWDAKLKKLIIGRSGWVAKVVEEAEVKPGDAIEVIRKVNQ
jgi:MOSC domain-containing protein YiiM